MKIIQCDECGTIPAQTYAIPEHKGFIRIEGNPEKLQTVDLCELHHPRVGTYRPFDCKHVSFFWYDVYPVSLNLLADLKHKIWTARYGMVYQRTQGRIETALSEALALIETALQEKPIAPSRDEIT